MNNRTLIYASEELTEGSAGKDFRFCIDELNAVFGEDYEFGLLSLAGDNYIQIMKRPREEPVFEPGMKSMLGIRVKGLCRGCGADVTFTDYLPRDRCPECGIEDPLNWESLTVLDKSGAAPVFPVSEGECYHCGARQKYYAYDGTEVCPYCGTVNPLK